MECLPVLHLFCNTQLLNNSLDIANKVLHDTNQIHCRRTTYPSQESSVLSFFRLFLRHRIPEEFKGCNTKSLNPSAMQVNTMTPTSKNKSPLVSPMYKGLEGYHVMGLRNPTNCPNISHTSEKVIPFRGRRQGRQPLNYIVIYIL